MFTLLLDVYGNPQFPNCPGGNSGLQRIASRCHCQIFYITFGGQISPSDCPPSPSLLSVRHCYHVTVM